MSGTEDSQDRGDSSEGETSVDQNVKPRSVGGVKLWMFRLGALFIFSVGLVGGTELILRLVGSGYPTAFFVGGGGVDGEALRENSQFVWRFMPRHLARSPQPVVLPKEKGEGVVRIFVLGESAAMGDPEPSIGLSRVLELLLEKRFPGKDFEVINTAITAINSHVITSIANDCAKRDGDFWVVYMGNNEVHGPFGPGTVFGKKLPSHALLAFSLALKTTRLGQMIEAFGAKVNQQGGADTWKGVRMFLEEQVNSSDARLETVYSNFKVNLEGIVRSGVRSGAQVVVGTVACNLRDFAPLSSQFGRELTEAERQTWQGAFDSGIQRRKAGAHAEALSRFQTAESVDSAHAELQFQIGRCLLALERADEARERFLRARDLDTLRFRTDSKLNEIIRSLGTEAPIEGMHLVDVESELIERASHGIPGDEFFWDHVHFRFPGNYVLALAFADQIARQLPVTGGETNWISVNDAAMQLGITPWSEYELTSTMLSRLNLVPFKEQSNRAERNAWLQGQMAEQARGRTQSAFAPQLKTYQGAVMARPNDWYAHDQLAVFLRAFGDVAGARAQWTKVLALVPHHFMARYRLGTMLAREPGGASVAEQFLREAVEARPYLADVRSALALALAQQKKYPEAKAAYQVAVSIDGTSVAATVGLGVIHARLGELDDAMTQFEKALIIDSNSVPAHMNIAGAYAMKKDRPMALKHCREVLRLRPDHEEARQLLGQLRQSP